MPFAYVVGIVVVGATFLAKEREKIPMNPIVFFWLMFIFLMIVSTVFALYPQAAVDELIFVIKVQIPIFCTIVLITDKKKLDQLLWILFISIGYFGVKGGIFTIITGGSARVWGPPGGKISENNYLAVALLMILPIMVYLRSIATNALIRNAMAVSLMLVCFSILGSQSRGAFLGICILGGYFWWQSKRKFFAMLLLLLVAVVLFNFMPQSWYDRMNTIDDGAKAGGGRADAWVLAYNVANTFTFGGGFGMWNPSVYMQFSDSYIPGSIAFVAHSIYFSVLGEHGWAGLVLFLLIFYLTWRLLSKIIKLYKNEVGLEWAVNLAKMLKLSLLAYASAGAFLSLSYFDLPWHLVAITLILMRITKASVKDRLAKYKF
jgi:probable O-glycosylation ligase (exosortase A-associated)